MSSMVVPTTPQLSRHRSAASSNRSRADPRSVGAAAPHLNNLVDTQPVCRERTPL
ncbi:Uncharacterised protein [Mycobacteroides abscessus subsp. abscessus]|nr:Uncharacterised protein [Mycobacteroides abscessus subsp. abscessus]